MKKLTLILIILLVGATMNALASEEAGPAGQFDMQNITNHRKVGTVSIKRQKDKSKVEFEGSNLRRGTYVLYLSRYCQPVVKAKKMSKKSSKQKSQLKNQLGTPILDFETQSGSLWSEQWLQQTKDLPIDNPDQAFVFVLVRKEKTGLQIIAKSLCARLNHEAPLGEASSAAQALPTLGD